MHLFVGREPGFTCLDGSNVRETLHRIFLVSGSVSSGLFFYQIERAINFHFQHRRRNTREKKRPLRFELTCPWKLLVLLHARIQSERPSSPMRLIEILRVRFRLVTQNYLRALQSRQGGGQGRVEEPPEIGHSVKIMLLSRAYS